MGAVLAKITRQDASNDSMLVDDPRFSTPVLDDVQGFLTASSNDFTTFDAPYEPLPDGSRKRSGGHRQKQCMTCHKWIDLGSSESGEAGLVNHKGKRRCLATVRENILEEERRIAAAALDHLHQTASLSPHTPYRPERFPSSPYSLLSPLSFVSGNSSLMSMDTLIDECPGIPLGWDPDDVFTKYPWNRHGIKDKPLGFRFPVATYDGDNVVGFVTHSTVCLGHSNNGVACLQCKKLTRKVGELRQLSQQPPGRLNYQYQTHDQLTQGHHAKNQIIRNLQLTNINLSRNFAVAKKHLEIDDRFVAAILSNKSSRVDQLIRVYTGQGASRSAITEAIQKASAGLLKVRSYTRQDIDMAMVMFRTGGRKLVYAANHALGLPSINTIRSKSQITHLLPSLGLPTSRELWHNITEVFGKSHIPLPLCGHSILIDEIAAEERPVFIKWLNSVGGLCREHTKGMDLRMTNVPGLRTLAEALFGPAPTIHFAKEATVAGIAAFRADHYEVKPIFAAGTCKKEKAPACVELIQGLLDAWKDSPDGEKRHGPIWSVASDGDGVRRAAFHTLFMMDTLKPEDPLFTILSSLIGLNLQTGKYFTTAEFDPKHLCKRLSTLLRILLGMAINDVIVNRLILEEYLVLLPNQTRESVSKLLNPADPQDVPRAIELIRAVADLRSLDTSGFNPSQMKTIAALQLIGNLFHAMIEPFVNPNLSLVDQMQYLAEYSHIALVLYRRNGRSFMSNQLYADSQVMVKNAFFYLAKQLLMNPELPVLLMLSGDDRLENLFGRVRMQGAHNCGVDLKTLMDRLAAAMDLCHIFSVHPSWDQGHRRLNYSRMEHCDHLKPASWKGDLIASSCNPLAAWEAGRMRAEAVLQSHHIEANFTEIFSHPNVDMLRPFPDGVYPGISTDPDPSMPPLPDLPIKGQNEPIGDDGDDEYEDELDTEVNVNMDDILDEPPASTELQDAAGDDWIEFEGQKFHKSSLLRIMFSSDFMRKSKERLQRVRAYTVDFARTSKEDSDKALLGVSLFVLGDLFATLVRTGQHVALAILQATGINHKNRKVASVSAAELSLKEADIKVSGQVLHLVAPSASSVTTTITGITSHPHPSSDPLALILSFPGATVLTNSSPKLSRHIAQPAATHNLTPVEPLDLSESTLTNGIPSSLTAADVSPTFLWIGDYIKFNALKAKKDKGKKTETSASENISRNALVLSSPSCMIEPISGILVGAQDLSPADADGLGRRGLTETWRFDVGHLKDIARSIWEIVSANKWKVVETGISFSDLFPYGAPSDEDRLIVATESAQAARDNQKSLCFVCGKMIPNDSSKRRLHIGRHIIKALRNVAETPIPTNAITVFPCGTCGKSTSPGNCAVTLTNHGSAFKIASTCPEFTGIVYASALKGSKTTPCTNVPVICELCVQSTNSKTIPAIWRYNLEAHIKACHPGHTHCSQFSRKFLGLLTIDAGEQLVMGIPQEQIPPAMTAHSSYNAPQGVKRTAPDPLSSPRRTKSLRSM